MQEKQQMPSVGRAVHYQSFGTPNGEYKFAGAGRDDHGGGNPRQPHEPGRAVHHESDRPLLHEGRPVQRDAQGGMLELAAPHVAASGVAPNSAQQGAAPAQAELRSRAEALWILLNRSGMTSNKGIDLIMERLAPDAPTPEYVSGWLAAADALEAEQRPFYAHWLRALAPPSAPPVPQIEARVQELLRVIHEEHADPPGCNCVYCRALWPK